MNMESESGKYIAIIGLEIHAELSTASKMFCSCANNPDEEKINLNVCSICLGHPGTLPVLNMEAIKHVLKMGISVGGQIADFTEWDRKNYFYPDIPKGYQISQYRFPLVSGGLLSGVSLERIHLEEDTAQSTHDKHNKSLVNFNRAGVPLMELVTQPVIHDAKTAVSFAKELQVLLQYLGAGEANMEKGEMRIEANISVQYRDLWTLSTDDTGKYSWTYNGPKAAGSIPKMNSKVEVKNLNSFKSVEKAITYEIARQTSLLEEGGVVTQETRGWRDDGDGETYSQRSKESSHDYRYFPDPDIPKLKISEIPEFAIDELKNDLPELPWVKRERFKNDFRMTDKEVAVFVDSPEIANYYEEVVSYFTAGDGQSIKLATNYILTDYLKVVKDGLSETDSTTPLLWNISPSVFAELISMIIGGELSSRGAKDLIQILFNEKGTSAKITATKHSLIQNNNTSDLISAIEKVIADNTKAVDEYKSGKLASLQFLTGQAMKATKGAGNPEVIKKLLLEKLG